MANYKECRNCGNREEKWYIYECKGCGKYFCGKCGRDGWCPDKKCGEKGYHVGKIG